MRVSSFAVARPNYYDRNATSVIGQYESAAIAPAGVTDRWTYTVAAGSKLIVETLVLSNLRVTIATASGAVYAYVIVNSGASQTRLGHIGGYNTTVGDQKLQLVAWGTTIYGAEQIVGTTGDYSTGGTTAFVVDMKATLFSA